MDTLSFKFPAGIDNRSREYALIEGAARAITNFDVTVDGGLRCRAGLREVFQGRFSAAYTPPHKRFMLVVKDDVLCRLDQDELLTSLTGVLGPVVFAPLNDEVFWSDGITVGRVTMDGQIAVWGLNPPSPVSVTLISGQLPAGDYMLTITAIQHETGLESGAGPPMTYTVSENGGLQVVMPNSTQFDFALYATPKFGTADELRQVAQVPGGGVATFDHLEFGTPCRSLLAVKPLPSQAMTAYRGRIWFAQGSALYCTSEQSPHWVWPDRGFFGFEEPITMVGAAEDGIYVGLLSRIYFLQGTDPNDSQQRLVRPIGALSGGGFPIDYDAFPTGGISASQRCGWWDTDGFLCIGGPGGSIQLPGIDRYSCGRSLQAVGCSRTVDGLKQVVSALSVAGVSPVTSVDRPVVERFTHNTQI